MNVLSFSFAFFCAGMGLYYSIQKSAWAIVWFALTAVNLAFGLGV